MEALGDSVVQSPAQKMKVRKDGSPTADSDAPNQRRAENFDGNVTRTRHHPACLEACFLSRDTPLLINPKNSMKARICIIIAIKHRVPVSGDRARSDRVFRVYPSRVNGAANGSTKPQRLPMTANRNRKEGRASFGVPQGGFKI